MTMKEAEAKLYDTTFLLGPLRQRSALKELALSSQPEAVEILVKAVDQGHQKFSQIKAILSATTQQPWLDRMWRLWVASRKEWLGEILKDRLRVFLSANQPANLPMDKETAWLIIPYLQDRDPMVAKSAEAYATRVIEQTPPFFLRFMLKAGRLKELAVNRKNVAEILALLADQDPQIKAGAEKFISGLPQEQTWNDLLVEEWLRSESPSLEKVIRVQKRLPSDPAKEALFFLVTGQVAAYLGLRDEKAGLLIEALAMASPTLKSRVNTVVLESKDSLLADAYRQATLSRQDLDPEVALRALIAAGHEDGLVKATEKVVLAKLLELCQHWQKTGRRPKEERNRRAVEKALLAFGQLGKFTIEPAKPLPKGLRDIFEVWAEESQSYKSAQSQSARNNNDLAQDLTAADPFTRASGLFLGYRQGIQGIVDQKTLSQKAKSQEWPERFIAGLLCPEQNLKNDHVHWARTAAGLDEGLLGLPVGCGLDEYERAESLRDSLKKGQGFMAERSLAHLKILQTFRGLFVEGAIVVFEDDSAPVEGGIEVFPVEGGIEVFDDDSAPVEGGIEVFDDDSAPVEGGIEVFDDDSAPVEGGIEVFDDEVGS